MAFTYDPTTDVGKIRLMIPDRVENVAVFQDDYITAFRAIEGDNRRAAALALETIASDTAATLRVTKVLGLSFDGAKTSDALLKRAAMLREQADADDAEAGGLFDWAEWGVTDFAVRDRLDAEWLRAGV